MQRMGVRAGDVKRSKMSNIRKGLYRSMLLVLLGATRALARADVKPPTKWLVFLEGLQASSDILYVKLSSFDEEVGDEFMEKEDILERRLGMKKFYSENEIQQLKEKQDQINIQKPKF